MMSLMFLTVCLSGVLDPGLWTLDFGLWTLDFGLWTSPLAVCHDPWSCGPVVLPAPPTLVFWSFGLLFLLSAFVTALARDMSRSGSHKIPISIGLSRCHG